MPISLPWCLFHFKMKISSIPRVCPRGRFDRSNGFCATSWRIFCLWESCSSAWWHFQFRVWVWKPEHPCLTSGSLESDCGLLWNKDITFYGKFKQPAVTSARWNNVFVGSLNTGGQQSKAKHIQVFQEQNEHTVFVDLQSSWRIYSLSLLFSS